MAHITQLASLLHAALHRTQMITIILAEELPPGDAGRTTFPDSTIRVSPHLTPREVRSTVAHEVAHLARGPAHIKDVDIEELIVEQTTAKALVPQADALASIDHRWTNAEVERLAEAWDVDTQTMHTILDPPTMPIPIPTQRDTHPPAKMRKADRRRPGQA